MLGLKTEKGEKQEVLSLVIAKLGYNWVYFQITLNTLVCLSSFLQILHQHFVTFSLCWNHFCLSISFFSKHRILVDHPEKKCKKYTVYTILHWKVSTHHVFPWRIIFLTRVFKLFQADNLQRVPSLSRRFSAHSTFSAGHLVQNNRSFLDCSVGLLYLCWPLLQYTRKWMWLDLSNICPNIC